MEIDYTDKMLLFDSDIYLFVNLYREKGIENYATTMSHK